MPLTPMTLVEGQGGGNSSLQEIENNIFYQLVLFCLVFCFLFFLPKKHAYIYIYIYIYKERTQYSQVAYIDVGYSLQWCTRKLVVREANTIACKTTDLGIKMECMNIPCCCRWWRSDIMVCSCHEDVLSLLQTCSNLLLLLWIKTRLNPNSLALRMASTR